MKDLEPLDPELAALFAREAVPEPPAGAAARLLGRVAATVAIGELDADGDAGAAVRSVARLGGRAFGLAAATFVLGAATGAGIALAVRAAPPPRVTHVEHPVASVLTPPSSEVAIPVAALPSSSVPRAPERRRPASVAAPAPASSVADTLGAERAVVEDARSLLSRGDAVAALGRLDEHARRFPNARLGEEREALAIQALVNMGRSGDARARADSFRARWPSSVYRPAVDATIRSIP